MDYKSIIKDIKNKQFKPIYALHVEEPYFIDAICDAIIENALEDYCAQPNPSTVFVICHKYKALDVKRKMVKELASTGLVFKSEKVKEYQLNDWISNYVKGIGFDIRSEE